MKIKVNEFYKSTGSKRTKKISVNRKKEGSKEIKSDIQDLKERSHRSSLILLYTDMSSNKHLLKFWKDTGERKLSSWKL